MFPIREAALSIFDIGDYWSREIYPPASKLELRGWIEEAWWRGEIVSTGEITRMNLLKGLANLNVSAVVPITKYDPGPPTLTELDDGSALLDPWPRVPVPSLDQDGWNEENCKNAFEIVADNWDYVRKSDRVALLEPALAAIKIEHDSFFAWLTARGITAPTFWAKATPRLDKLLADAAANHPKGTVSLKTATETAVKAGIKVPRSELQRTLERLSIKGKQGQR